MLTNMGSTSSTNTSRKRPSHEGHHSQKDITPTRPRAPEHHEYPQRLLRTGIKLEVSVPDEKLLESDTKTDSQKPTKPTFITKKVFQRVGKCFKVKLDDDIRDCAISGSGFLTNGNIVLADFDNKRLKLFDVNLKHLSHVDLKVFPQNLCTRDQEMEVYVTFNDQNHNEHGIQVVSIKDDNSMTVLRTIKIQNPCYGISSNNGGLAVMVNNPNGWEIHLMTLTGILKSRILPKSNGKNLLVRPDHVTVTKDLRLLVSDRGNNSIFCFNTKGELLFQYSRLRQPMSITLDYDGSILVACPGMVHQFNMKGEKVAPLMSQEDIGFPPICLSYDPDDSLLVIAGQSNFIVAYKLSDYRIKNNY